MSNEKQGKKEDQNRWGTEWATRTARALMELDRLCSGHAPGEVELRGIKLRLGETDRAETLVVVTAWDDAGAPIVGFGNGMAPSEALVSTINRVVNGQIKWKEDSYG